MGYNSRVSSRCPAGCKIRGTRGVHLERREVRLPEVPPSDQELVRRTLAGDRSSFGELVGRYERVIGVLALQKVGNAQDAEDVAQEAFLKAYAALGELEEPDRFGSWLYGIAFRAAIDHLRRRGRRGPTISLEGADDALLSAGETTEGEVERRERAERVMDALGELPDKYRLVITLRYQKHMGHQEIADHLGEPAGTISNRLHRAANMLKERLRELWEATKTR
jgi:RNA polymerase sigma-70 factor, ECF subfamily